MAVAALLDRHVAGDSLIHRLDARAKLLMALVFIFSVLLTPPARWEVFAAFGVLFCIALSLSRLSPWLVVRRSLLALPFLLAAVPMLFRHEGASLFTLPLMGWTATDEGLAFFASILLRSWLSVLAATLLTATTRPEAILRGLRSFGVPKLLVGTIAFMWRYVFVIVEEAQRMMLAREARSARLDGRSGGSLRWRASVAGTMVGSLFLRSLNRGERVYLAMLARGYSGEILTLHRSTFRHADYIAAASAAILALLVVAYARF